MGVEQNADFLMCIGDDKTDEDMFEEMKYFDVPQKFPIVVEKKKSTMAKYFLKSQDQVYTFLSSLVANGSN